MKKIFVTGGAGYVGSHTCKALAESGYQPISYDNLSRGHREFAKWGPLIEGDIEDFSSLNRAIKQTKPDMVIHFAALASVPESFEKPNQYYQTNVIGTLNVIEAMLKNDVNFIVFSSSCSVYGIPSTGNIKEDHPRNPINPYGLSKMMCGQALNYYHVAHNLKFIELRYFNAAGADPQSEIGEKHEQETRLIPLVIQAILQQNHPFCIYGNDFDTRDGTAVRDYVHVSDLAAAHVLAAKKLLTEKESNTFNLGSGKGVTVSEIAQVVEKIARQPLSICFKERRRGDPPALIADITKAQNELGWFPKHSDLNYVIETAWKWHKQYL